MISGPMKKKISLVLPVFNEEGNIPVCYERIKKVFENSAYDFEIIFVDDGSSDRSLEVIDELAAKDSRVKYISFSRNFGHQFALTAGLDFATGEAVITMDSDLQHPPELIPELLSHWENGYEIVFTIRKTTKNISLFKKLTADLFYWFINSLSEVRIQANSSDFRLIDQKVCKVLKADRERDRFFRGLIPWVGFKQKAVEFHADPRLSGHSGYTFGRMIRFATHGIIAYSYIPIYLIFLLAVLFFAACLIYMGFVLYQKFVTNAAIPGQTSILISVLLMGTIQLIATFVAIIYSHRNYQQSKGRPLYIINRARGVDFGSLYEFPDRC